ncbi:hypothetical protein LCGC14_2688380 [marine sediment metagenome]|uniref:HNH nuclease domain-containing protein n=1 Tax=marine sediment metagenome TaxID=412755 RepID=A0A0F9A6T8_9ZZZZ
MIGGKYQITGSGCWEWTRCRTDKGYGQVRVHGKAWRAHRLSYTINVGPIPDGLFVLHDCDNPPCVNPAHLHLGDHSQNLIERWNSTTRRKT